MNALQLSEIIERSFSQSYSYKEFRDLMDDLLTRNQSTAKVQEESLTEYSKMNQRRMKRWEKTLKISEEAASKIKAYKGKLIWLVITESWCGDAAHSMPVMNKLAELNSDIEIKVVLRDEHEELMNQFLTNGGKSIPKLVMYQPETKKVIAEWGPRPTTATQMVEAYKTKHGKLDAEFKEELQRWYNKDKGQTTIKNILALL
ncbi:Thiol-disulfide isomerase or thioredoxin [Mesonia phycicola]|uniref:Thiol-disulfide isomerase or thioredoxin n=1 Tax=Mesonia phycicola TaxID=579105 RepID=A0A1M6HFI1_9FLAO|nr:thioredoxin family protein [Mesonia phycicola]SHJ20998.1 Thiol-disulfide isomerase or thioredoxin [Mesonia phycicola]